MGKKRFLSLVMMIRLLCVCYIISIVFTLISALTGTLHYYVDLNPVPAWFYGYSYIAFLVYLFGFIGILLLKKGALVFLTIISMLSHPVLMSLGLGNLIALTVDTVVFGSLWILFHLFQKKENRLKSEPQYRR